MISSPHHLCLGLSNATRIIIFTTMFVIILLLAFSSKILRYSISVASGQCDKMF